MEVTCGGNLNVQADIGGVDVRFSCRQRHQFRGRKRRVDVP